MALRTLIAAITLALFGSLSFAQNQVLVPALPDGQVDESAVFDSLTISSEPDGDNPHLYWGEVLGKRFGALFGSPPSKKSTSLTIGTEQLPQPVVHLLANVLTAAHCDKIGLSGTNVDWDGTSERFEGGPLEGGWSMETSCRDIPQ